MSAYIYENKNYKRDFKLLRLLYCINIISFCLFLIIIALSIAVYFVRYDTYTINNILIANLFMIFFYEIINIIVAFQILTHIWENKEIDRQKTLWGILTVIFGCLPAAVFIIASFNRMFKEKNVDFKDDFFKNNIIYDSRYPDSDQQTN